MRADDVGTHSQHQRLTGPLIAKLCPRPRPPSLIAASAQLRPLPPSPPLQEMRTWKEAEEAGKKVGFELVTSIDLAIASIVTGPW